MCRWLVLGACILWGAAASAAEYVPVAGASLRTALPTDGEVVQVAPFAMRTVPVTNEEFAGFLQQHPQWQRGTVAPLFVSASYLEGWRAPLNFAPLKGRAPVTSVSWYAAKAFCETENARLPTWYEWELVAAADESRKDARADPAWRTRILSWYEKPGVSDLPPVGKDAGNVYGIHNLHQTIWEWVEDYNGLFVTADSRSQGEQKTLESCGAASLSLGDKENYAVLMRIALLSSLNAKDSVRSLGFRCVRDSQ